MDLLTDKYNRDQETWDQCAPVYEQHIVSGHPDITAFENFEEDFLDRVLHYLAENQNRSIKLMDIGCGSGRLHVRYGAKTRIIDTGVLSTRQLAELKKNNPGYSYDPLLTNKIHEIWGIDFSKNMINLAQMKLQNAGLGENNSAPLTLVQGSAFELTEQPDNILPLAVCLVNSIGVMQGPAGAIELFKSMRRAVEKAGGIAIISCYQQEYLESYGLGQYESTLDVSGQPWWMRPTTYASEEYTQVARHYKLANCADSNLIIDVYDKNGHQIQKGHILTRDRDRTNHVLATGHIKTYSNYESNWYSYQQMDEWMEKYWPISSCHIATIELDKLRAEPAQLVIFDPNNHLENLFNYWGI